MCVPLNHVQYTSVRVILCLVVFLNFEKCLHLLFTVMNNISYTKCERGKDK